MNKLVSKNSVLRFRLGKLILRGYAIVGGNKIRTTNFLADKNGWKFISDRDIALNKLRNAGYINKNNSWIGPVNLIKPKPNTGSSITTTPRFLSRYSDRMSEIGGVNNIKAWLEKLKDYYDAGTYKPDSVWGDNTEKAYRKYLADNNINLGLVKLEPVSISPVKESVLQNDFAQDKQTGYPSTETIQSSSSVLNLQNDFASDRQNYYPSVTTNIVSYNPNFNWRNALAESQKLHFVKQGGQLVSRNSILRFKLNFR